MEMHPKLKIIAKLFLGLLLKRLMLFTLNLRRANKVYVGVKLETADSVNTFCVPYEYDR